MNIVISEDAVDWYKQELQIKNAASLRFFVRYGGIGGQVPGFSLGINIEDPDEVHTSTLEKDITFYIEESDAWYFEDKDLIISFDRQLEEPQFIYK